MRTIPIEISADNPFANCKLNREQYANVLTSIVEAYDKGFVLAVNGKWGTGKTTFMNMWKQSLVNQGYKTIYFNAWENDFTSEPMVAILGELKSLTTTESSIFDNILEKSAKFSSTILPALAKTAATLAGFGGVADVIEKTSEAALSLINNEIEEYDKKKEALSEIKNDLAEFIKENCGDKPLVFIVDELDRCRPDYAVEVLEKIKHLFAVEGVVFVLSIDKEQLGHAVCGYYGSENIDSREYLRRFIDLEYTLPEPDFRCYISYLYELNKINEIIQVSQDSQKSIDHLINVIGHYCDNEKFSLRQLNKIFAHAKIVARSFGRYNVRFEIIVFLIVAKEFHQQLYLDLRIKSYTPQEITNKLLAEFRPYFKEQKAFDHNPSYFIYLLLRIIYYFSIDKEIPEPILKGDSLTISFPEFESIIKSRHLTANDIVNGSDHGFMLSQYIEKIELLSHLKS